MANTYTQLFVQFVFAVRGRENLIHEEFRNELEKIICVLATKHKSKPLAVFCNPDHTHVFLGIHPTISISKLIEQIKAGSSKWINDKSFLSGHFSWQDGYGAFTYSKSQNDSVIKYILNQPEHHKKDVLKMSIYYFLKNLILTLIQNIFLNGIVRFKTTGLRPLIIYISYFLLRRQA